MTTKVQVSADPNMSRDAVMGKEDTLAALKRLIELAESGEIECCALRVYKEDGTWEDVVFGGTAGEREAALSALRKSD